MQLNKFSDSDIKSMLAYVCVNIQYAQHIKPIYFKDDIYQQVAKLLINYHNKNKEATTTETNVLKSIAEANPEEYSCFFTKSENKFEKDVFNNVLLDNTLTDWHDNYLAGEYSLNLLKEFVEWNKFSESLLDLNKEIRNALEFGNNKFDNPKEFLDYSKREFVENSTAVIDIDLGSNFIKESSHKVVSEYRMKTGHDIMDRWLDGGYGKGELLILSATSGGGKSALMVDLAAKAYRAGKKVLIVSLEMSETTYIKRLASNILKDVTLQNYDNNVDNIAELLKNAQIPVDAQLIVKYYHPGTATVGDISAYIKRVKDEMKIEFDLIFVDYIGILKIDGQENSYNKYKQASIELRAMASIHGCQVITASQVNRSGMDKTALGLNDIAESMAIVHNADNIIAIQPRNNEDIAQGVMRISPLKVRNADSTYIGIHEVFQFIGNKMTFKHQYRAEELDLEIREGLDPTLTRCKTLADIKDTVQTISSENIIDTTSSDFNEKEFINNKLNNKSDRTTIQYIERVDLEESTKSSINEVTKENTIKEPVKEVDDEELKTHEENTDEFEITFYDEDVSSISKSIVETILDEKYNIKEYQNVNDSNITDISYLLPEEYQNPESISNIHDSEVGYYYKTNTNYKGEEIEPDLVRTNGICLMKIKENELDKIENLYFIAPKHIRLRLKNKAKQYSKEKNVNIRFNKKEYPLDMKFYETPIEQHLIPYKDFPIPLEINNGIIYDCTTLNCEGHRVNVRYVPNRNARNEVDEGGYVTQEYRNINLLFIDEYRYIEVEGNKNNIRNYLINKGCFRKSIDLANKLL